MKKFQTLVIIIILLTTISSCSSLFGDDYRGSFYCYNVEWEHLITIYKKYGSERCKEATKIRHGNLMLDSVPREVDNCKNKIAKLAKKNKCCVIHMTKNFKKTDLPACPPSLAN